jgi:hypothetical protein
MRHIQGLQDRCLQDAEDNDIRSDPECQVRTAVKAKPGERRI